LNNAYLELELPSERAALKRARKVLGDWLAKGEFTEQERADLLLGAHEALTNAIIHGNRRERNKKLKVRAWMNPEGTEAVLEIEDEGLATGWNPPAEDELSESGRGLALIRRLVDELEWSEAPGRVRLVKRAACSKKHP